MPSDEESVGWWVGCRELIEGARNRFEGNLLVERRKQEIFGSGEPFIVSIDVGRRNRVVRDWHRQTASAGNSDPRRRAKT